MLKVVIHNLYTGYPQTGMMSQLPDGGLGPELGDYDPFVNDLTPIEDIRDPTPLPDGSLMYNVGKPEEVEEEADSEFYENLASNMSSDKLSLLASKLLEEIKQDQQSRADWESSIELAMKYLGHKIEESRDVPFMRACSAFDSTLGTALINFYSMARAELFPAAGPARCEVVGKSTPEIEDQGERVKMFINWYLTKKDKDYYPDSERLLLYVGFMGSAFRKTYQDPILNRPVSRFVSPLNLIINNYTTSLMTSDRMTEVLELNRKEVLLRQRSKDFIEFELPAFASEGSDEESAAKKAIERSDGIKPSFNENKSLFKFYESHVNLLISEVEEKKRGERFKDTKIPRPYIVTICEATQKVVSVRRNWKEEDKKYERINYFTHYSYLPGFGIYSLGLAHVMGSNAITLTSILRQLIDAGTLKNFPGGLRVRGMRIEDNDKAIGPSEFREIETGGTPLQDCIMLMPYQEPSQVLTGLYKDLQGANANVEASLQSQIPDIGSNAPVGTTLAMLEVSNRVQSSALRSLHVSLGQELQLLFDLFGEYLTDTPYPFAVPGQEVSIMKKDFSDSVNIVPVSDPNVLTTSHRLMRNEAILKIAQSNPDIHDMREVYYRVYTSMNVDDIEKLLPAPEQAKPLDPITENMMIMTGKPVTVAIFQDDDSHIALHSQFEQSPLIQQNPQALATLSMHSQRHKISKAYKTLFYQNQAKEIEGQMAPNIMMMASQGIPPEAIQAYVSQEIGNRLQGVSPPNIEEEEFQKLMVSPEIQNMVAQQDAQQAQQQAQQQSEEAANALNSDKLMLADIEQRREAAHLKNEESGLKAETEAFKAQLKYEAETSKTEAQKEIASEKHEVDMIIAESKMPKNLEQPI